MLVLTRRNGEALLMNDGDGLSIEITVLRISGNSVRLGINAPDSIFVLRDELEEQDAGVRGGVGSVRDGRPTG